MSLPGLEEQVGDLERQGEEGGTGQPEARIHLPALLGPSSLPSETPRSPAGSLLLRSSRLARLSMSRRTSECSSDSSESSDAGETHRCPPGGLSFGVGFMLSLPNQINILPTTWSALEGFPPGPGQRHWEEDTPLVDPPHPAQTGGGVGGRVGPSEANRAHLCETRRQPHLRAARGWSLLVLRVF